MRAPWALFWCVCKVIQTKEKKATLTQRASVEDLDKTNSKRKEMAYHFVSSGLEAALFSCPEILGLYVLLSLDSETSASFLSFYPQVDQRTISLPSSQALVCRLHHATHSPGSPASTLTFLGLLSFPNYIRLHNKCLSQIYHKLLYSYSDD